MPYQERCYCWRNGGNKCYVCIKREKAMTELEAIQRRCEQRFQQGDSRIQVLQPDNTFDTKKYDSGTQALCLADVGSRVFRRGKLVNSPRYVWKFIGTVT